MKQKKRIEVRANKKEAHRKRANKKSPLKTEEKRQRNNLKEKGEFGKEITITITIVVFLFSILSYTVFALPKVEGYGMTPILNNADRVFVNRLGVIKRFKLIYFRVPNSHERTIRRVIGTPNESIFFKNDQLYINHQEIAEPFLQKQLNYARKNEELATNDFNLQQLPSVKYDRIPKGNYLVLGDNRQFSTDSRYYGLVDEKDIIGTVEMRILPLHKVTNF